MGGPGLDRHGSRLVEGSCEVTHHGERPRDVDPALMRRQLIPDASRKVASLVRRQDAVQVARDEQRPVRLPFEYVAQPPPISQFARKPSRLDEIRLARRVRRERHSPRHQRANQQRLVSAFPGDLQRGFDCPTSGMSNEPYQESSNALSASALTWAAVEGRGCLSRRRRERCRARPGLREYVLALATPTAGTWRTPTPSRSRRSRGSSERGAQVVDLLQRLRNALLMAAGRRGVELCCHRPEVVAVSRANVVGLARLAEFLQRVLADGFQLPVSGSAAGVFGDDQRLVDEQAELVEDLEALHLGGTGDGLGRVEVEAAHERSQAAEQDPLGFGEQERATSPRRRATSAGCAPRCGRHRSAVGNGRAGCRRSHRVTARAPVPPPVRWPAACRRGGGRCRSPFRNWPR